MKWMITSYVMHLVLFGTLAILVTAQGVLLYRVMQATATLSATVETLQRELAEMKKRLRPTASDP